MGKINQGILGSLSSSVGMVTGAVVKGRPTLRRKVTKIVNPNTDGQQQVRSAFGEASAYCRENWDAILAYCDFKEQKGKTIWNQAVAWYLAGGRLPQAKKRMHYYTYRGKDWLIDEEPIVETVDGKISYVVSPVIFAGPALEVRNKTFGLLWDGEEEDPWYWNVSELAADGRFLFQIFDQQQNKYIEIDLAADLMARYANYVYEGGAWEIGIGFGTWHGGGTDHGYIELPLN